MTTEKPCYGHPEIGHADDCSRCHAYLQRACGLEVELREAKAMAVNVAVEALAKKLEAQRDKLAARLLVMQARLTKSKTVACEACEARTTKLDAEGEYVSHCPCGLGNAVVPQVVEVFGRAILAAEEECRCITQR